MIAIYKIVNTANSKIYIGQTWNIDRRYNWNNLEKCFRNDHLKRAVRKYGADSFILEILNEVDQRNEDDAIIQIRLNELEKYYIKKYKSYDRQFGYNKTFGGEGGSPTEETRRVLSEAHKGKPSTRKGYKHTEETKRKMSESMKGKPSPRKGIKLSDETKKKLSESHRGDKNPNYGRHFSEEHKRKIGEGNKDKVVSENTRKQISETLKGNIPWNKGKKMTEEYKEKYLKGKLKGIPWTQARIDSQNKNKGGQ